MTNSARVFQQEMQIISHDKDEIRREDQIYFVAEAKMVIELSAHFRHKLEGKKIIHY